MLVQPLGHDQRQACLCTFRCRYVFFRPYLSAQLQVYKVLTGFTGRRICVGKNLALTHIRLVTATLLLKYCVRFAPGENGEAVERDIRDQLTAQASKYRLVFKMREIENRRGVKRQLSTATIASRIKSPSSWLGFETEVL